MIEVCRAVSTRITPEDLIKLENVGGPIPDGLQHEFFQAVMQNHQYDSCVLPTGRLHGRVERVDTLSLDDESKHIDIELTSRDRHQHYGVVRLYGWRYA